MKQGIEIIADHREIASRVPSALSDLNIEPEIRTLKHGDYIINNQIIIERKTKDDFVQSLMQQKLFIQVANLRKNAKFRPIILIEGNPYHTKHDIAREALKGALLSISVSWQIPVIYSANAQDSAQTLVLIAKQNLKDDFLFYRTGYKPKTISKKQNYFLQGLPNIGPKLANALLSKFGSIENIMLADEEDLGSIAGIGKTKAKRIREFIGSKVERK
jgi:DNA excision repair protein ERCC-4